MTHHRSTLVMLLALPLALVFACGGIVAEGGSDAGGPGGTPGTGGQGGVKQVGGSGGSKFLGTCVDGQACTADTYQYEQCILAKCDSSLSSCYGAGYKTGSFSGPCGPYINCINACPCDAQYNSCVMNCMPKATSECQSRAQMAGNCVQNSGCVDPCAGAGGSGGSGVGGSGGSGMTCQQLKACCDAHTGQLKASCEKIVSAGNEDYCSLVASTFCK